MAWKVNKAFKKKKISNKVQGLFFYRNSVAETYGWEAIWCYLKWLSCSYRIVEEEKIDLCSNRWPKSENVPPPPILKRSIPILCFRPLFIFYWIPPLQRRQIKFTPLRQLKSGRIQTMQWSYFLVLLSCHFILVTQTNVANKINCVKNIRSQV